MVTWITALAKTRDKIAGALSRVFARGAKVDQAALDDLEMLLIQADVPARLASEIIENFAKNYRGLDVPPREMLSKVLVQTLGPVKSFAWQSATKPKVILVVGINGSGKTTTCAKLAYQARQQKIKPILAAADTFRAAGSDQLRLWAEMVDCEIVVGKTGADAASVAYDAVDAALARQSDLVIIDTAGRMHTKQPLMQELQKVQRAIAKRMTDAPHEVWIVLDASIGQNAILQAKTFHQAVPLTGVVVAKLDGSAKGGFIFAIQRELNIPVRFVGLGEGREDLAPFDPQRFMDALLGVKREVA